MSAMDLTFAWVVMVMATLLALPAFSLLLLVMAAGNQPRSRLTQEIPDDMRVVVLVPAHNESNHVVPTIASLLTQLGAQDRVLVIADNCDDDTAQQARAAGADVVERFDSTRRGKGYALAFGVDALRDDPPDVVLVVDADCQVSGSGVRLIAAQSLSSGCPVQMLDLMVAPSGASLRTRMLAFAWLMKNQVRPQGTQHLGQACHLMGTGMALPWRLISKAQLATGHVAEDMKLGVDFTLAGLAPKFSQDACVVSYFPTSSEVARVQKSRWEHGHLQTLREELPRLLISALRQPHCAKWTLALDLMIPPMALYVMLLFSVGLSVWLCAMFLPQLNAALVVLWAGQISLVVAVLLSWWRFARQLLSLREMLTTPWYALWKLPVYLSYFAKRRVGWIRTKRD